MSTATALNPDAAAHPLAPRAAWRSRLGAWSPWRWAGLTCLGVVACYATGLLTLAAAGYLAVDSGAFSGTPGNWDAAAAWSPDGSRIAFASNRDGNWDIYVMAPDGSSVQQLTRDPLAQFYALRSPFDSDPAWSPDGSQIVFSSGRDNGVMSYVNVDLYVMQADGSQVQPLLRSYQADRFPDWSPDGRRIAVAQTTGLAVFELGAKAAQTIPLNLQAQAITYPNWSPDGSRLAFSALRDDHWDIYVVDADGSHLHRLTYAAGGAHMPRWSPDGAQLLYSAYQGVSWDLYVMDADGSNRRRLTADRANDDGAVWSPDGSQIAFVSDRDGDWDIYVMQADGSNVVQLTGVDD